MAVSGLVRKYSRFLEEREINYDTESTWKIGDVPKLWRKKTQDNVIHDGFYFLDDGTAMKNGLDENGNPLENEEP